VIDAGQVGPVDEVDVDVPPVAAAVVVVVALPPVLPLMVLLGLDVPPVAALPPAPEFADPPALDGDVVVPPLSHATARSMEEPSTTMPSPVIRFSAIIRNLPRN